MPSTTSVAPVPDRPRRVRTLPLRYRQVSPLVFDRAAATVVTTTPPQGTAFRHRDFPQSAEGVSASGVLGTQGDLIQGLDGPTQAVHIPRTEERARGKRLLQEDIEMEDSELKVRIRRLERSERRLKARLAERDDESANKDAELGEIRRALNRAEEGLSGKEEEIRELIREVHHYQGWWLNEHYCLRAALTLARNRNDVGVKAMKESSNARFMKWCGSHQP